MMSQLRFEQLGIERNSGLTKDNQVRFASKYNIPFLAVNMAHGTALDLSNARHGISIYINALDSISINKDSNTATLGGGTYQDQLVRFLDSHGKASRDDLLFCLSPSVDANIFQQAAPVPALA